MARLGIRLSPKGKTLVTDLFLNTCASQIQWYKLHRHAVLKLQHFIYRDI